MSDDRLDRAENDVAYLAAQNDQLRAALLSLLDSIHGLTVQAELLDSHWFPSQ